MRQEKTTNYDVQCYLGKRHIETVLYNKPLYMCISTIKSLSRQSQYKTCKFIITLNGKPV